MEVDAIAKSLLEQAQPGVRLKRQARIRVKGQAERQR